MLVGPKLCLPRGDSRTIKFSDVMRPLLDQLFCLTTSLFGTGKQSLRVRSTAIDGSLGHGLRMLVFSFMECVPVTPL